MKPYYRNKLCTIYHGDAREIVPALGLVDFIFTDPPYGHNNNNGDLIMNREAALGEGGPKRAPRKIANDGPKEAAEMAGWLFRVAVNSLREDGCCCCCCCGGGGPDPQFARWSLLADEVLNFKQMVVWDKGKMGLGWHYRRSYETVLVGQKGTGRTRWYDRSHRVENIIRPGDYGIRKVIPTARDHPTQKPTALAQHFIGLHTLPGDLVMDPFMGSGSTLIAAQRTGRRAIGIDVSKRWCKLAAKRLSETGMT